MSDTIRETQGGPFMRGEGRVFRRGRYFWIAYYAPGPEGNVVEIRESSDSESESIAKKLLRDRVREVANHRRGIRTFEGPKAERLTVGDLLTSLLADYGRRAIKGLSRAKNHARPVRDFFGDRKAMSVTADHVRTFIEYGRGEGWTNATINRRLEILSAAYGLALKEDRIARKPYIPHLSERGNARQGFFERDQHEAIVAKLPAPIADIARFAYVCGWRQTECRLVRWEYVDRGAREVTLPDSKNGEGRVLPLEGDTWELFERLWTARQYETRRGPALSEFVFHRNGRSIDATTFAEEWRAARDAAGPALKGRIFHDYRRTAARNMIRAGVPQAVAMKITGHVTDSMFRRYNIVSTADTREALQKQRDYLKNAPGGTKLRELRR